MNKTIEKKAETLSSDRPVTYSEAAQLIAQAIASLRIYVVESDITEAQDSVRAIVEQASF